VPSIIRVVAPLLVVVDMQRVFADRASPWAVPAFDAIVPGVERLVGAFEDRTVYTRFVPPADPPAGSWADYYALYPFFLEAEAAPLVELVPTFALRARATLDVATFTKHGERLEALAGPDRTIVLCGVTTECCVLATALDAADAGMHVRVVEDACTGVTPELHEGALVVLAGYEGHVALTTVDEELAAS